MIHPGWIAALIFLADLFIRVGFSLRVIMRRLPVGVSLAWLTIILVLPFAGAILYLLVGEYHLGWRQKRRMIQVAEGFRDAQVQLEKQAGAAPEVLEPESAGLARLARAALGAPLLSGNRWQLLPNAESAFPALIADIDQARWSCHLEFYIWSPGGIADEVGAALIRASRRGVQCRVLVDALGSSSFLRSPLVGELRQNGVQVQAALPVRLLGILFVRPDLRLHRKIVVIDGQVGYTGSLNLADPRLFKQNAGVGKWVDALVRLQGPAVTDLALLFLKDWAVVSGLSPEEFQQNQELGSFPPAGQARVQVLSSGPAGRVEAIEEIVLMAIYGASQEIVLTTPYFIPSESMLAALTSAAGRGVKVTLIVPQRVDSRLTHYASRAHQMDLLRAGVQVALYQGGLLHTKSITVDGRISLFGSLNLDPRSMRLDFEVTLSVYDRGFCSELRGLQQRYLEKSILLDLDTCLARSALERFAENTTRLVGALL
jgi:cardiolipin synthase